jgi:glucan phosphorylase
VRLLSHLSCTRTIILLVRLSFAAIADTLTDRQRPVGKELRLKQQYFWTAASLADILRRFKNLDKPITELPDCMLLFLPHALHSF